MKKPCLKRIQERITLLKQYSHEYYVLFRPTIRDIEYDRLYDELCNWERSFPELIQENSPTQKVGSDLIIGETK